MKPEEYKKIAEWNEFYSHAKRFLKNEEEKIQGEIVNWMRNHYPDVLFYHYPAGGSRHQVSYTNKRGERKSFSPEATKLKAMGTIADLPDLFADHPISPYLGFRSEVKKPGESLRKGQKEMHQRLTELGYYLCVVRSLEEFQDHWARYDWVETMTSRARQELALKGVKKNER